MIVLGISGKAQSGKDTVAAFIQEALDEWCIQLTYTKLGFADALYREIAKGILVASGKYLGEVAIVDTIKYMKENKSHFRMILQGWGTDFRRELHGEDYWVNKVLSEITKMSDKSFVVVPDVRFKNEMKSLVNADCEVWNITRPTDSKDTHISETSLDGVTAFDAVINNDMPLDILKSRVWHSLAVLLRSKGYKIKL